MPTTIFQPNFNEAVIANGNERSALNSAQVHVLFEGASWNRDNEKPIIQDIQTIVNSSYLSQLSQYTPNGGTVQDSNGNVVTDNTPLPSNFDPPNDIQPLNKMLQRAFDNPSSGITPPSADGPTPIYVMITDATANGGSGYNAFNPGTNNLHEIWVSPQLTAGGAIDQDALTLTFSHELAESMAAGVTVSIPSFFDPTKVGTQIADGEPEIASPLSLAPNAPTGAYAARLNGTGPLVQAYWSQAENGGQGAFVVPDGEPQTVNLQPIWNGTVFTGTFNTLPAPARAAQSPGGAIDAEQTPTGGLQTVAGAAGSRTGAGSAGAFQLHGSAGWEGLSAAWLGGNHEHGGHHHRGHEGFTEADD